MQPALHTLMFGSYGLDQVAPIAREIGYQGVALMCRLPHLDLEDPERSAAKAFQIVRDSGLTVVGLASGLGRPDSFHGEDGAQELDGVRRAIEAAKILEAGLLRLWAGPEGSSVADSEGLARAASWYADAAEIASAANVRVTIEVHSIGFASTTQNTCRLLDAINHPNLGVALDTGNLHASTGVVGSTDVQMFGERLFDVHVKDMRELSKPEGHTLEVDGRYFVHLPMSEGDVRNDDVVTALSEAGYEGWIANESECTWDTWERSVVAARHEFAALQKLIHCSRL